MIGPDLESVMQDEIVTLARLAHSLKGLSYDDAVSHVIGDRTELYDDVWDELMDLAADDSFGEDDLDEE